MADSPPPIPPSWYTDSPYVNPSRNRKLGRNLVLIVAAVFALFLAPRAIFGFGHSVFSSTAPYEQSEIRTYPTTTHFEHDPYVNREEVSMWVDDNYLFLGDVDDAIAIWEEAAGQYESARSETNRATLFEACSFLSEIAGEAWNLDYLPWDEAYVKYDSALMSFTNGTQLCVEVHETNNPHLARQSINDIREGITEWDAFTKMVGW